MFTFCTGQNVKSSDYEYPKGKWPLPLQKYLRVSDNEERKHYAANLFDSVLRIVTDSAYPVTAVHDSYIYCVFEIEGDYSIITTFGNLYLAYSSLIKPNVKEGEYIKTGQVLGTLTKNWTEPNYTLELWLSKNGKQIDPTKYFHW